MAAKKLSFTELYRANQARVDQESAEKPDPSEATLTLNDLADDAKQIYTGGDLMDSESHEEDVRTRSQFASNYTDLDGLADPNQTKDENPYISKTNLPVYPAKR